tara:strand:+ start:39911 stop:41398 length:1488 start_codon:yes stop_codon:yes gene_type:complete
VGSNILLKVICGVVVFVLITLVVVSKGPKQPNDYAESGSLIAVENGPVEQFNGLDVGIMDEKEIQSLYGVDVDSPVETMRTLTNETRAVRKENEVIVDENLKLKSEIDRLLRMEESMKKRLDQKADNIETVQQDKNKQVEDSLVTTRNLINKLEERLLLLSEKKDADPTTGKKTASGFIINDAGIPQGLGYDETGNTINYDEVVWINPVDAKVDPRDPSAITLPKFSEVMAPVNNSVNKLPGKAKQSKDERLIKAYTIPSNATLLGSVSMTALLGRIPIDGRVTDPYPFKIIIGEDNLSSNGISIPNVTGIKMSGVAKGDWTLSCASGQIFSMTFTFQDGTIVTIPEPGTKTSDPLAWFSDTNGIPCITGKRITNAVSFLAGRIGLTAASSYSKARADAEFSRTSSSGVNGTTTSSTLTGNPSTVARNEAIGDGLDEVTSWIDRRQAHSFDAIYVPPGTKLAVHIVEELKIDYDPEGRKVNHYADINPRSTTHID